MGYIRRAVAMEPWCDDSKLRGGISRRGFLAGGSAALAALAMEGVAPAAAEASRGFEHRGYYITFMRMPTFGLAAWKLAIDCFAADGINLLILWMAGGFRSKKFPQTWKYNEEHENVRADFAGELIRYAQAKGIKILLGFTPFGYDGVNQYTIDRPELRARKKDGQATDMFGIHCWGWNLCPSKPDSQRFMLEYIEEMFFDFYPDADGLLIESSDYAICHCPECAGHFYEREFDFVSGLSQRVWRDRPRAMIVVYPHYFSGSKVPGLDAEAAKKKFDPRWTLFFTPHSAHPDRGLIGEARSSIWSDDGPALHGPQAIRQGAIRAREAKLEGYLPSLEGFSYITTHIEEGRADLIGQRQIPFGFGWLKTGEMPYNELPIRVNRIAYREFSQDTGLGFEDFRKRLGREIFGGEVEAGWIEDLLLLQGVFFTGRTWCQSSPLVDPQRVRIELAAGRIKPAALAEYRESLRRVSEMVARHADSTNAGRREVHRIGGWVLGQWSDKMELLKAGA